MDKKIPITIMKGGTQFYAYECFQKNLYISKKWVIIKPLATIQHFFPISLSIRD